MGPSINDVGNWREVGQKLVKIADRYYHKTSDMGEGHTHYTLSVDIS